MERGESFSRHCLLARRTGLIGQSATIAVLADARQRAGDLIVEMAAASSRLGEIGGSNRIHCDGELDATAELSRQCVRNKCTQPGLELLFDEFVRSRYQGGVLD